MKLVKNLVEMSDLNIIPHIPQITRKRRNKLNGHKSSIIWFTGLSGSGKSTLAYLVEEELHKLGCNSFVL